ncbi:intermembrane lipid transfer protein VPS13D-like isoform X2 [Lineus longissimus]|uniref:intermembrane lipid transfer protein VPS13D-like isoform X2 n=1 Tax=Lineus longissimus TaxID=88925 RepID=UPI00315D92A6
MLEGLAAWVLNTYVGEYLENLNTDQLSIGLLQGAVELENLPLKKDALKSLDLPLEVKSGYVGRITLKIPVRQLRSEPWVISIDNLYLVAGPIENREYDEEKAKAHDISAKKAQLDALEAKWQGQRSDKSQQQAGQSWLAYGTSLATNIIENVQLQINNVHLRYEDDCTVPGSTFACGIIIKSLSAQSTDGQWVPKFVSRDNSDVMHKLVDLQNFSIYWDDGVELIGDLPHLDLAAALQKDMDAYSSSSSEEFTQHDYMVQPVSAQAQMKRYTTPLPLRSVATPRIGLDIKLEKIPLSLSDVQHLGIIAWIKEFERYDRGRKYRKWRPTVKFKENKIRWWWYAIKANLTTIQERSIRSTKHYMLKRAKENVIYVKGYTQYLVSGTVEQKYKVVRDYMEETLTFEELKILREVAMDRASKELKDMQPKPVSKEEPAVKSPSDNRGVLQRWWTWTGYGASPEAADQNHDNEADSFYEDAIGGRSADDLPPAPKVAKIDEAELEEAEQEVFDMLAESEENNTLLRRDIVFARINFCLEAGSFKIFNSNCGPDKKNQSIMEIECSSIKMGFESRPRTSAFKFDISVGGIFLKDTFSEGCIFPVLLSPQKKERTMTQSRYIGAFGNSSRPPLAHTAGLGLGTFGTSDKDNPLEESLFSLVYEQTPPNSGTDHRLTIKTKPLDIVYNPTAIKRISDFFNSHKKGLASRTSELKLTTAAKTRYEELKNQTKAGIKHTLDQLLEGEDAIQGKRWAMDFDISAPQIIIPENFNDPNTIMVVFDFGHLQFGSVPHKIAEKDTEKDDSTIPTGSISGDQISAGGVGQNPSSPVLSDVMGDEFSDQALLHEKIYDRYTLDLSDLQVMTGRARDNWRQSHFKGTGHMHVVDRFSISLQFERRLIYSADPKWPSATLAGNLPSLVVHVNESKIQALKMCMRLLMEPEPAPPSSKSSPVDVQADSMADVSEATVDQSMYFSTHPALSKSTTNLADGDQSREYAADSRQLIMQFSINQMSLEIQSRGRSVAELQVSGARANFTKRPYDTSIMLTVHSLLVVDALQTYGQDFELLVASHRNLCIDSKSGSIRDSDPNSPVSPQSPQSPQSPSDDMLASRSTSGPFNTVQSVLSSAFQSLVNSGSSFQGFPNFTSAAQPPPLSMTPPDSAFSTNSSANDSEALITVEFEQISPNGPSSTSEETVQLLNIQFNSLDIIANTQTIVELLSFFKRVLPEEKRPSNPDLLADLKDPANQSEEVEPVETTTEVTAEFQRLNILLMRAVEKDSHMVGKKVATATLTGAKIEATIVFQPEFKKGKTMEVKGSLGGLQMIDLTPEGTHHQKVVTVGHDPNVDNPMPHQADMYKTAHESMFKSVYMQDMTEIGSEACALSFHLRQVKASDESYLGEDDDDLLIHSHLYGQEAPKEDSVNLVLRMASLIYTHSPQFLNDLSECATEFKDYMSNVAESLKYAATEVAMGLVHKRSELLGASFYGSTMSLDSPSTYRRSRISMSLGDIPDDLEGEGDIEDEINLKIDAVLQTPIIVLPKTQTSPEVLVAHLGKISIRNVNPEAHHSTMMNLDTPMHLGSVVENKDRIYVDIRDMSLYSMNIDELAPKLKGLSQTELFSRTDIGEQILHDTMVELTIDKIDPEVKILNLTHDFSLGEDFTPRAGESVPTEEEQSTIMIKGRVVNPLRVVLAKKVYEQILRTVDNITYNEDFPETMEQGDKRDCKEETLDEAAEDSMEPGVSALKLDETLQSILLQTNSKKKLEVTKEAKKNSFVTLKANFDLPIFDVEMRGDFADGEQGLVNIKFQNFNVVMEKNNPTTTSIQVTLQALDMEDLLQEPDSRHRHLVVSSGSKVEPSHNASSKPFLSTSCPNSTILPPAPGMPSSLPSNLHKENAFVAHHSKSATVVRGMNIKESNKGPAEYPCTPPPSPFMSRSTSQEKLPIGDALVHINVLLVDKKSPEYTQKYNKTNRFVDVDFNSLDTVINLQTWVVLLDFLGMGAKVYDEDLVQERAKMSRTMSKMTSMDDSPFYEEVINTEVNLNIQSLSLILNKPDYELAKASVSKVGAHVSLRDGNFAIVGKLGSMSLMDTSLHGAMYREKFMTLGDQALDFDVFKYGTPDPGNVRPHDIRVKLRMASVRYTHTQRFMSETIAFCQHFMQLQDLLGRMRAASAGKKISETATRGARISLDVVAGSPVILIPHSSLSKDILVVDLGTLTVSNTFLVNGSEGSILATMKDPFVSEKEDEKKPDAPLNSTMKGAEQSMSGSFDINASVISHDFDLSGSTSSLNCMDYSMFESSLGTPPGCTLPDGSPREQDNISIKSDVNLYSLNSMTKSVYGSLDHDLREEAFKPINPATNKLTLADFEVLNPSPVDKSFANSMDSSSPDMKSFETVEGNDSVYESMSTSQLHSLNSIPCAQGQNGHGSQPKSPTTPRSVDEKRQKFSGKVPPSSGTFCQSHAGSEISYFCLLDVTYVDLVDMDLFSAERVEKKSYAGNLDADLEFPSFVVQRQPNKPLKEKCVLKLQVERNLEGDVSHSSPDFAIMGMLSAVECSIDLAQYKLIRGILDHNLGEPLEEFFSKTLMSHLQDPKIHTVLSGDVWKCVSINLDLVNVSVELLHEHFAPSKKESSLAKLDFISSRLTYESYSDQSKDVDLVSKEIVASDTRYQDQPVNTRPNVFENVLQPLRQRGKNDNTLQLELHYRSTKLYTRFTILLNNMRLMGVIDWLLAVKEYLLTNPDNPFLKEEDSSLNMMGKSGMYESLRAQTKSPMNVGGGIVTKRVPVYEKPAEIPFELKLNVTETDIVVVEDTTARDTNAVILKMTAVLTHKPSFSERPLSCSLQSLEVFSCCLASENETALSIIDPMTITIEMNGNGACIPRNVEPSGLLDATLDEDRPPLLEVGFSTMNIRLSYNDMQLFLAIMNSLPKQADQAKNQAVKPDLLEASEITRSMTSAVAAEEKPGMQVSGVEVRASLICLCLIDDCQDADVPLAEFNFAGLHFLQKFQHKSAGQANFKLSANYFNRVLSGWEPVIEPWGCQLAWNRTPYDPEREKLTVNVTASDVLNINVSSVLMEQYKKTKKIWMDDYYNMIDGEENPNPVSRTVSSHKTRTPFVPFMIRNHTGCKLWFATVTTAPTRISLAKSNSRISEVEPVYHASQWKQVKPGEDMAFTIEGRDKMRHKSTHELRVHQLVVKVDGWNKTSPVSVDRVGVYFRTAKPEINKSSSIFTDLPPARVVFAVNLEGSARKVITVRSALQVVNKLDERVILRLNPMEPMAGEKSHFVYLESNSTMPIPLAYVTHRIWARPLGCWSVDFCNKPIHWQHVMRPGEIRDSIRTCNTQNGEQETYRFCVAVKREGYPAESHVKKGLLTNSVYVQPGHSITLAPPVVIENLLPVELHYYLKMTDIKGTVKAGKEAALYSADLTQQMELGIKLENFEKCRELVIPPGTTNYLVKLRVYDNNDRLLNLQVRIMAKHGGSLRLTVSAPFWLINKSGLPIIFKQDNAKLEAAGQFEEHELARSVTPLLFSFADKEAPFLCSMRIGKSLHDPGTISKWCSRFQLESGIGMRKLHVAAPWKESKPDLEYHNSVNPNMPKLKNLFVRGVQRLKRKNHPKEWVYHIGIEVRQGRGRYRDTTIVNFAPKYQLDNRTRHKLAFGQSSMTKGMGTKNPDGHTAAVPNCHVPFHWPTEEIEPLLSVRLLEDPHCQWSGGFSINVLQSFHVTMRGEKNQCLFLRVEVYQHGVGATNFVVFTDADQMPPPFRVDNFSEVPITFYQTKIMEDRLKTVLKPKSSMPYALDEPNLPPHVTCSVQGGSCSTYSMSTLGNGDQLCYENFIYIRFTGTFSTDDGSPIHQSWLGYDRDIETRELVLDVPNGNMVTLKRKEQDKRSQLWRMTSQGMLQHEGSSTPRDPRRPSMTQTNVFVLDIEDIALQPGRSVKLMLRKPDERRKSTQTWRFTEDGRLQCIRDGMCVQAKIGTNGLSGLKDGCPAFLGKCSSKKSIPIEMAVSREKLRPGSGMLSVKVVPDGPTRVLQITDINFKEVSQHVSQSTEWVVVKENHPRVRQMDEIKAAAAEVKVAQDIEFSFHLSGGLGVSLINHVPEELVYISLKQFDVDYLKRRTEHIFEASIRNIQVDNQLFGAHRPVMLFVTPASRKKRQFDEEEPALSIKAHKIPNSTWNAEIFKHLLISMKRTTLQLEEELLWKLLQFAGYNQIDTEFQKLDESDYDSQKALSAASSVQSKRYYFGNLRINTSRISLSVITANKLSPDLLAIKNALSIPLIKFEDAKVEIDPFTREHPFETSALLWDAFLMHYTRELKGQAAKILGSVDFLGNPLGLFNDVTEGISGLIKDGNVGGLVKNVTHGISNSTAKFTGSLSDGLGTVAMDDKHQSIRDAIRSHHSGSSSDHLVAGFKGLGFGLLGGITSIVQQTYKGASQDGVEGFFTGFGKGVVGTVTKPVAGVLDLASGAASAVRDTSKSKSRHRPNRGREPRCVHGAGGLLPVYSNHHANAQKMLFTLNGNNFNEMFIALEQMRFGHSDNLRVLISNKQVYFLKRGEPDPEAIILNVPYEELYHSRCIENDKRAYLELTMKADNHKGVPTPSQNPKKRPIVRCDSENIAHKVAQQINYAKTLYDEMKQTLIIENEDEEEV